VQDRAFDPPRVGKRFEQWIRESDPADIERQSWSLKHPTWDGSSSLYAFPCRRCGARGSGRSLHQVNSAVYLLAKRFVYPQGALPPALLTLFLSLSVRMSIRYFQYSGRSETRGMLKDTGASSYVKREKSNDRRSVHLGWCPNLGWRPFPIRLDSLRGLRYPLSHRKHLKSL